MLKLDTDNSNKIFPTEVACRKKPQQRRARLKFQMILDATCRLLEKNCFSTLTTNHIAEESGLTVGSIYQFFSSKEDILYELATIWFNDINTKTNQVISKSRESVNTDVKAVLRDIFCYVATEYKSPVSGAEKELTKALSSSSVLSSLDQKNKDLQVTTLYSLFKSYQAPVDDEALLSLCRFLHELILSCAYQVAYSKEKEKEMYLALSLDLLNIYAEQVMRGVSNELR